MVKEDRTRTADVKDGIKDRGCPGSPFIFQGKKSRTWRCSLQRSAESGASVP